jgi:hypothetical protein
VKRSPVRRAISTLLAVIGLVGTAWACAAAPPALTACPAQAAGTVTQLYRWSIGAGDTYREHLDQQEALFEPGLYQHLQAAFRLQPEAGAVLDFDPFNGAQVSSYGFRLEGCRVNGAQLVARLQVKVGLGPERVREHPIRIWLSRVDGVWRIDDFEYAADQGSTRLQPLLDQLLSRDDGPSQGSAGEELLTPGFRIVVVRHCPEGTLHCDEVSYQGEDRQTGASISLKGSTTHHTCPDGVTPCRFLGYRFENGDVIYEVSEDGLLRVTQGGKVLLQEQGEWQR